ncbi:MAG: 3'(2'),5'-bisphosphate nucleotidase CysQ [Actinobacteria bacterium]|uniref:inositol monophosphatase family protein n=1 Tax=Gordonia sp. (in: high G+C Gram-positive bacteria) TaxID=84139 RepID=UPI002CE37B73|nr:3'(2'),5'-bisphosphate nucleotidase CysQ [Micrococcales bacterium]MCB9429046.1 3'(2'),5'-bisphosphate nucleotidase CysQ [Actinomycetota bacterium]MCO5298610.1 3'(2'),5'-bisphosphate nucleotidase CysQ [Candidatus Nanopelagicales bacterium]HPE11563.1 inositol monophosphatase family protein [Actinomycetota bacterium]HPQ83223.1 inositol monophosphatase family protein [Actinomycetota bacterium]
MVNTHDAELAKELSLAAGRLLLDLRTDFGPVDPGDKARRSELKDVADAASQSFLAEQFARERPGDAILSEEAKDSDARDDADRVWIIDPLDGTSEYSQGRSDWAVQIALWERGAPGSGFTAAAFSLPSQEAVYTTGQPVGSEVEPLANRPLRVVVSRSRPPELFVARTDEIRARLAADGVTTHGVEFVYVGSAGAKVGEILAGRVDAYVNEGGFWEWDAAAPLAVAVDHGMVAGHLDARTIEFNKRPPWVDDIVIARPEVIDYIR